MLKCVNDMRLCELQQQKWKEYAERLECRGALPCCPVSKKGPSLESCSQASQLRVALMLSTLVSCKELTVCYCSQRVWSG